jgi:hypothetical protein
MDKCMVTRRNKPDYFLLNDGPDDEALPEDCILETAQSVINPSPDIPSSEVPSSEILPSESISQAYISPMPTFSSSSILQSRPQKHARPAPTTNWIWDYFEVTPVDREWIVKRTKKRELIDWDIQCAYIDNKTGI